MSPTWHFGHVFQSTVEIQLCLLYRGGLLVNSVSSWLVPSSYHLTNGPLKLEWSGITCLISSDHLSHESLFITQAVIILIIWICCLLYHMITQNIVYHKNLVILRHSSFCIFIMWYTCHLVFPDDHLSLRHLWLSPWLSHNISYSDILRQSQTFIIYHLVFPSDIYI